ncbi:MAG: hypothetical protein H7Z74_09000 [Anaerolineae bacterium]|nr:hypothetical protein [Gemmatimonadaceae bacterium]
MTFRHTMRAATLCAVLPVVALAQGTVDARCQPGTPSSVVGTSGEGGDACQKGIDLFNFMAPQLGMVISSGNATLGQAGALGGLGRFTFSLRGNALQGGVPDIGDVAVSTGSANSSAYGVDKQVIPMVGAEGAIGLFGGIPVGLSSVLGVDALVSAFYVPEYNAGFKDESERFAIETPDEKIKVGYGVRIGLIGESLSLPGVSFTWLKRDLPGTNILARPNSNSEISLLNFDNNTTAWRLVAGKRLGPAGIALGYGKDVYKSNTDLTYGITDEACSIVCVPTMPREGSFRFDRKTKATTFFGDLMLNVGLFTIVGEIGQVKADDVDAGDFFNTFSESPAKSRLYGSVGFRLGR